MTRGIRFASRYGFAVDPDVVQAIAYNAHRIVQISGERIWSEFAQIICAPHVARHVDMINNVMQFVIPNIHRVDWQRVSNAPQNVAVRFGMIMAYAGITGDQVRPIARRMACENDMIAQVRAIVDYVGVEYSTRSDVRVGVFHAGQNFWYVAQAIIGMFDNYYPANMHAQIQYDGDCVSIAQIVVDGNEVRSMGYEGVEIGRVQRAIIHAIMQDEIPNERNAIMGREW